jgi:hypothetical protein
LKLCDEYGIALSMIDEKKGVLYLILLIFLFSLGFSLFINLAGLKDNFLIADESTYYIMTRSIVQDGDIEYTRKDLTRYYQEFDADPQGIFLKKRQRDGKLFYGKSFAYPLFSASFVKIFGLNGFLVFHAVLLSLILYMGFLYFYPSNRPGISFLTIFSFFFASIAAVYFLWISSDFFNFFLVFSILFLWLYKYKNGSEQPVDLPVSQRLHAFLLSDWSDYLACILTGVVVFSKPPNIVLMGPLVLHAFFGKPPQKEKQKTVWKRLFKSSAMGLIFVLVAGLFFGANHLITGEWNYQGGDRRSFYAENGFPLEKDNMTFDNIQAAEMTSENYADKHLNFPVKVYFYNVFYYFFGRFTGIVWYYFPAFLFLILFFFRKKKLFQWLILGALTIEILIYVILMPDNFAGGGGALANRYFLHIYPLFLFLPGVKKDFKEIGAIWVMASLFIAPILISPIQHSHYPATHAKRFPFKMLPVELTIINNIPTNANPAARRQSVGTKYTWLYFLDDNFIPRTTSIVEKNGFYTRGSGKAEMILKTWYPIKKVDFILLNNPRLKNEITVWFAGEKKKISLGRLQRGTLSFTPKRVFRLNEWTYMYKLSVKASKGSIPHYEEENSMERRHLGVFFELDITPVFMPD